MALLGATACEDLPAGHFRCHASGSRAIMPLFSLGSQNDFLQHRASLALYRSPLERNRLDIWHISYLFLNLVSKNPLPNVKLVKHPLPNARKSVYVIIVLWIEPFHYELCYFQTDCTGDDLLMHKFCQELQRKQAYAETLRHLGITRVPKLICAEARKEENLEKSGRHDHLQSPLRWNRPVPRQRLMESSHLEHTAFTNGENLPRGLASKRCTDARRVALTGDESLWSFEGRTFCGTSRFFFYCNEPQQKLFRIKHKSGSRWWRHWVREIR